MAAGGAGYFNSNYFHDNYWNTLYWLEEAVTPAPATVRSVRYLGLGIRVGSTIRSIVLGLAVLWGNGAF